MSEAPDPAALFDEGLRHHDRGELRSAKNCYLGVLRAAPEHAGALHYLGNIDIREGDLDSAERLIRRAIEVDPRVPGYHVSLGNVLYARHQTDAAVQAYRAALELAPDFSVAHNQLGDLWLLNGRIEEAIDHFRQAITHDPAFAPAWAGLARAFNNLHRYDDAADAFQQALRIAPQRAGLHNGLGRVYRNQRKLAQASKCFQEAVRLKPRYGEAHHNLGTVYLEQGRADAAIECFRAALEHQPGDVHARNNLGLALHALGRLDEALEQFQATTQQAPEQASGFVHLGVVLDELRRPAEAESALRRALEIDPGNADAWGQLAALFEQLNRTDEFTAATHQGLAVAPRHPQLNLYQAILDRRAGNPAAAIDGLARINLTRVNPRLRRLLHFELGNLYDRTGDADQAWSHFVAANQLASRTWRVRKVDPQRYLRRIDALTDFLRGTELAKWTATTRALKSPVFLVGFPRSGTTLTDVILDSHDQVQTLEEKPTLNEVENQIADQEGGYPAALPGLDEARVDECRRLYFQVVEAHLELRPDVQLIDKLPMRTLQMPLIYRLFPDAKIVFSMRHPCDVVLSGFMQDYAMNDAFANFFTMEDAVRIYDKVMRFWRLCVERLPINYHVVRYEGLVENTEAEARRLFEFLDLPWDDAVLAYGQRVQERGLINTTSYHQVAEPIYQRAVDRWLRYRAYLAPHMEVLRPHVEEFGYSLAADGPA